MSKIDIQVHALPTEKANGIVLHSNGTYYPWRITKIHLYNECTFHHLYATSSETPKEGDWVYCTDGYGGFTLRKVISRETANYKTLENGYKECHIDWAKKYGRKVVATDDQDLWYKGTFNDVLQRKTFGDVPPISPEFKQAWVREANKGTPIVDAMIEMNEPVCKCDTYEKILKCAFACNGGEDCTAPNPNNDFYGLRPKLNAEGYVIILPIKEKMYKKEEVVTLTLKMQHDYTKYKENCHFGPNLREIANWTAEWLKQNL